MKQVIITLTKEIIFFVIILALSYILFAPKKVVFIAPIEDAYTIDDLEITNTYTMENFVNETILNKR